jgi:N-acyl-D-aspartate/D-glutamate deacylase
MSVTIEEIEMIVDIVAKRFKLEENKPSPEDVKSEMDFRKAEVAKAKAEGTEIRLNHYNNTVSIYYNGKEIASKKFNTLSDAVFYLNKQARTL